MNLSSNIKKIAILGFFLSFLTLNTSYGNIVKSINIEGNDRISDETIKLFSKVNINENLNEDDLNKLLKNLYDTNFFKNINISFENNLLLIKVTENPIIENVDYKGIKAKKILNALKEDALIKSRLSYNEILLKDEKKRLIKILKNLGYYSANLEIYID